MALGPVSACLVGALIYVYRQLSKRQQASEASLTTQLAECHDKHEAEACERHKLEVRVERIEAENRGADKVAIAVREQLREWRQRTDS